MYGCKFAAKSNAFFSQYGWVHLMLPKWVKSKLALTKALLGRRGQNERSGCERPGVEGTCSKSAVIQAHFTVIEGDGCTQCLQVICHRESCIFPSSQQLLWYPVGR